MPWARFDDHMPTHRKVRPLTDAAFRLWVSAVCYSNAYGTDSFILRSEINLVSDVKRPLRSVAQLVAIGLWEEVEDGWLIHDFHEYNPSSAQVDAQRKLKTERQRRWREGRAASDVDASTSASVDASRDAAPSRPVPTRPVVTTTPASAAPTADESAPAKPSKPKRPAIEDPEQWERFWKAYPRKKDKGAAEKAWNRAIRSGIEAKTIIDGLLFYVLDCRVKEPQFIKYPATWLNARGWQDEADPAPRAIGAPSEAAAVQPRAFAEMRHEFMPRQQSEPGLDFGDVFRMPE